MKIKITLRDNQGTEKSQEHDAQNMIAALNVIAMSLSLLKLDEFPGQRLTGISIEEIAE